MHSEKPGKSYWGVGLTIAIALFMILTLGLLFFSSTLRFDQVTETHYEDASVYQERINAIKRTKALLNTAIVELTPEQLTLTIPTKNQRADSATVQLYKPDNRSFDRLIRYTKDQNIVNDTLYYDLSPALAKGKWLVKAEWWSDGFNYYNEQSFLFE